MKVIALNCVLLLLAAGSFGQDYQVPVHVVSNGGGTSQNSSYGVVGTIGQMVVSSVSNTVYKVNPGFWPQVGRATLSGIPGLRPEVPAEFWLGQNYPNPFNPSTTIPFTLGNSASQYLTIYSILGQQVARYDLSGHAPGRYSITWNGQSESGISVGSGVYLYRLEGGFVSRSHRMTLLK